MSNELQIDLKALKYTTVLYFKFFESTCRSMWRAQRSGDFRQNASTMIDKELDNSIGLIQSIVVHDVSDTVVLDFVCASVAVVVRVPTTIVVIVGVLQLLKHKWPQR